jgi:hypothetical protein
MERKLGWQLLLLQIQNFMDKTCLQTNLTIVCFLNALCAKNP